MREKPQNVLVGRVTVMGVGNDCSGFFKLNFIMYSSYLFIYVFINFLFLIQIVSAIKCLNVVPKS